jgi:uncharacterized protein YgbK (DUF1537 family)
LIDTVLERDLDPIGEAALATPLSVGASGLGIGLARALLKGGLKNQTTNTEANAIGGPIGGPIAALSGSCSQATLNQVERAGEWGAVLRLDTAALASGPEEAQRALAWALPRLKDGPVLIASTAPPNEVQALQAKFGRENASHAIEQGMAAIASGMVEAGVRRLIVAGGETSGAVVDRLGLQAFSIGAEIAPGVPVLRTVGGKGADMVLALKSGNFGGPDFFADAARLMP